MTAKKTYTKPDTVLAVAGRDPDNNFGIVNPPVYHASTILSPTMAKFENRIPFEGYGYGRNGTPTQKALEDAVAAIEGAHRSIAVQSGLAAVTGAIVGFLKTGDHMLLTDNAYGPARRFANTTLKGFGVETTFFDPMIGAGIEKLMRPNTRIVYLEAPGSQTFEVQDVDALAAVAKKHGAAVLIDNTWATPLYFKPFDHGCDLSIHAGTKYIVGHSDAMMGIISCRNREMFEVAKTACQNFGFHAAPDDSYLALRGLRTMAVRLRHHEKSGLNVAHWLKGRPEVDKVLHPALPDCPGHDNWKRMFKGSSGLFSFTLRDGYSKNALAAMLDGMDIFGMGASWGGYESLMIPAHPDNYRTAVPWPKDKHVLRVHIGLEDVEDLKTDLAEGFERLNRAHNA
jgi:cystathionine beta-lyase